MGLWKTEYDPYIEDAMGTETGRTSIQKFGRVKNLQTGIAKYVWNGPTNDYYFTSGNIGSDGVEYYVSSSNALDTQVTIFQGIDELGFEQRIILPIDGQNKIRVGDTKLWFRMWRLINANGSNFAGDIYVYEDTTVTGGVPDDLTKIRAFIEAGDNQTQMAIWTMPINEVGSFRKAFLGISSRLATTISFEIYARVSGGVFALQGTISVNSTGTGAISREYDIGRSFFGGADVIVIATSDKSGVDAICEFDIQRRLAY